MTWSTFLWYSPSYITLSVTIVDFISNDLVHIQFLPNLTRFVSPMSSRLFLPPLCLMLNKSSSRSDVLSRPIGGWRNRLLSSVIGSIFLPPPSLTLPMPHLLPPSPSEITLWCKFELTSGHKCHVLWLEKVGFRLTSLLPYSRYYVTGHNSLATGYKGQRRQGLDWADLE